MTIGEKLQLRRKELQLTQDQVAQKLHVSRQAVSNWELGKNHPDLETFILISDVYQLSLDTLLKGDQLVVKEMKRTINRQLLKKGGLALAALASIICLIIDLAINRQLTWSIIVIASLTSLIAIGLTYDLSNTQPFIKSIGCLSLLLLPYLFLLERSLLHSGYTGIFWFKAVALPVTLLWLTLVWLTIICQTVVKWHWAYSLALFAFLSILGNQVTHIILGSYSDWVTILITSGLGSAAAGLAFLCLGYYLSKKQTRSK